MKLTEEQLKIIESNEKKILVKAGAGTGKTELLTRRILRLIEDDPHLSINDMAIITFTNKATEVLRERIKRIFYTKWANVLDPDQKSRFRYELELLNSAHIFTIHQFCQSILQDHGPIYNDEIFTNYSPLFSIRSNRLRNIIELTIENWIQAKKKKNITIKHLEYFPIHKLAEIIETTYQKNIRQKGLDLSKIIKQTHAIAIQQDTLNAYRIKKELIEIIKEVHNNLFNSKFNHLDVDDLLEYCAKLLQNQPDLLREVQNKYKHIFIDEFQDTSLYQAQIIKHICGQANSPSLFIVGDIKQSIYQFRGADPDSYSEIEKWIKKEGIVLKLTTNWRSTPEIVHYVNTVFDNLKEGNQYSFHQEHLKPSQRKSVKLKDAYKWLWAKNKNEQNQLVAKYLEKESNRGKNLNQFAILVRYNDQLTPLANELEKQAIPYKIVDSGNLFNQREIIHIYRVLKSIIDENDDISTYEAKKTIFFYNQQELYHKLLEEIFNNQLVFRYSPSQMIDYICQKTNVYSRCTPQMKANLNKLKEKTRQLLKDEKISLFLYIDWLSKMINGNVDEPLADVATEENNVVSLMTIHKAKGLEFPFVILPYLDQGFSKKSLQPEIIIDKDNLSLEFYYKEYHSSKKDYAEYKEIKSKYYDDSLEKVKFQFYSEELRVLYVALTRAKEKLILVGNTNCKNNKICYQNWLLKKQKNQISL